MHPRQSTLLSHSLVQTLRLAKDFGRMDGGQADLRREIVEMVKKAGRANDRKLLHTTLWNFAENIHKGSAIRVAIDRPEAQIGLSVGSVLDEAAKHRKTEAEVMAALEQALKEPPVRK